MSRLPLFKYNSRARSTSWGIALCTMFLVASFSVASGLKTSMDKLEGNFDSEYALITKPGNSGPSFFSPSDLSSVLDKSALGLFSFEELNPSGINATVFSISDQHQVLMEAISTTGSNVLAGADLPVSGNISIGVSMVAATVTGHFSSTMFPSDWLLTSDELIRQVVAQSEGVNFAIAKAITDSEREGLIGAGFSVQGMIGIMDFLGDGVAQIEQDVWWVLIPSSFVIAVLAYSFLGSETVDRRREIGILKAMGAGRSKILSYLISNALIVSAWGGALGLALGIVLSYAISTSLSAMFTSAFTLEIDEWLLVASYLATAGAGVLGALIPALRMTSSSPVDDLKEVSISS